MTKTVKEQILFIRDMGITNMFDVRNVLELAAQLEFEELYEYLQGHKDEYAHFILTGECE